MSPAKRSVAGKLRAALRSMARTKKKRENPEFKAMEAEKARARYERNKDKYRDISLRSQQKRREEINAKRREQRRLKPTNAKLNDKKWRSSRLKNESARLKRGEISLDEFSRRVGKHLAWYDERIRREGRLKRDDGLRSGKADHAVRKIKA